MLTETERQTIQLLNNCLTLIGDARSKVDKKLQEKLSREQYLELSPEVTGIIMFAQGVMAKMIRRMQEKTLG